MATENQANVLQHYQVSIVEQTDDVVKLQFYFPSTAGDANLNTLLWVPASVYAGERPRAIVQIVHGMVEFVDRYDTIARELAAQGYVVGGEDHYGHGDSVKSPADWGYIPKENGDAVMVEDVHTLRCILQDCYGDDIPYFIYGHSMGSFITRAYITCHAQGLAGAIICGTGDTPASTAGMGMKLSSVLCSLRGPRHVSKLIDNMALGGYNKAIKNPRTPYDWLTYDEQIVDKYAAEPRNTFKFTVSAYHALMKLLVQIAQPEAYEAVPKDLPLLIEGGNEDPVGNMGTAIVSVASRYTDAGVVDVQSKVYAGMRHEIHNEVSRDRVVKDTIAWLEKHI